MIFKRNGSSNFHYRQRTPQDILRNRNKLEALGIRVTGEVGGSLGTSDKREAKTREAEKLAEWGAQWERWREALTKGPRELDVAQQWAVVTRIALGLLDSYVASGGPAFDWKGASKAERMKRLLGAAEGLAGATMRAVDRELSALGLVVSQKTRRAIGDKLVGYDSKAVRSALKESKGKRKLSVRWPDEGDLERIAEVLHQRETRGNFKPVEFLVSRPGLEILRGTSPSSPVFDFAAMFTVWEKHRRGVAQRGTPTVNKYRRWVDSFSDFLEHDDPALVMVDDVQRYLEHISKPRPDGNLPKPKTVHDIMVGLSTVYNAAISARKLSDNPITPCIPAKAPRGHVSTERKNYTAEETGALLRAARGQADPWLRWGPWLMAYTGMRVQEAGQLRKQDIEIDGGGRAFIHIRPEAGHTKSGTARLAPVRRALEAEGFLEFVRGVNTERLFPKECLSKDGLRTTNSGGWADWGLKSLGAWVRRSLNVVPKSVKPNHGLRHGFRHVALGARLMPFAVNEIAGWKEQGSQAAYGEGEHRDLLVEERGRFPQYLM